MQTLKIKLRIGLPGGGESYVSVDIAVLTFVENKFHLLIVYTLTEFLI
jgi:hypothetical protein